jgi:hypothetical protein
MIERILGSDFYTFLVFEYRKQIINIDVLESITYPIDPNPRIICGVKDDDE